MKLVIPFFQSEFDPKQLLKNRSCQNPPLGDFGDFLVASLAIYPKRPTFVGFNFAHFSRVIRGSAPKVVPGKFGQTFQS